MEGDCKNICCLDIDKAFHSLISESEFEDLTEGFTASQSYRIIRAWKLGFNSAKELAIKIDSDRKYKDYHHSNQVEVKKESSIEANEVFFVVTFTMPGPNSYLFEDVIVSARTSEALKAKTEALIEDTKNRYETVYCIKMMKPLPK